MTARFVLVAACVLAWSLPALGVHAQQRGHVTLDPDATRQNGLVLDSDWLYHPGDEPAWADPAFADDAWESADSRLMSGNHPAGGWPGVGWFRIHVHVGSSLRDIPLGISIWQIGITQVYVNGRLVYDFRGDGSTSDRRAFADYAEPIQLSEADEYVLAVRHESPASTRLQRASYREGFGMRLGTLESLFEHRTERMRRDTSFERFFLGGLFVLFLLHLMLYGFNRNGVENLYYAVFTASIAFVTVNVYSMSPVLREGELFTRLQWWNVAAILAPITGVRFAHVLFSERTPRHFYVYAGAGVLLALWGAIDVSAATRAVNYYCLIGVLEFGRIIALARWRRKEGAEIIAYGALVLLAGTSQGLFVRMDLIEPTWNVNEFFLLGVGALLLSMSVHLARSIARTNRDLRIQLRQVKELSATITEQEVERRLLEMENVRKTRELEEAHAVQLAMLPKTLPLLPGYELAVYMKAATEIGGDYYDFHTSRDGTLTVAIGDATGHGAKAGTMVTAAKSLFTTLAGEPDLVKLLIRFSEALRAMHLPQIYLALALLRVHGDRLRFVSAGMPPLLVYRAATGEVEEIRLKGLPLGSPLPFPYTEHELELAQGDVAILMSDGLPEVFSPAGDMLGYDGASRLFKEVAAQRPKDIIDHLQKAAHAWASERGLSDDITFVVIRRKVLVKVPASFLLSSSANAAA